MAASKVWSPTFAEWVDDVVEPDHPGERVLVRLDQGGVVDFPRAYLQVV